MVISNVLVHMLKMQLPSQNEMVPMYEYMAAVSSLMLFSRLHRLHSSPAFRKHRERERQECQVSLFLFQLLAQTATYPLSVLTTVMAVNRSGLRAGLPPLTPIYSSWQDAYRHLGKSVSHLDLPDGMNKIFFSRIN